MPDVPHCRDWDARYGWDLLAEYGPTYDSYIAVTSPSAWRTVEEYFPTPPRHLEFERDTFTKHVEPLIPTLPDAELVLAIGGGTALDVGKYVAALLGKPIVFIPTIVSTGSIFQPSFSIRTDNPTEWGAGKYQIAPEYLLLDYGVIRQAPAHLNCMGMGECICQYGAIGSWRWWVEQGLDGPAWDQAAADATADWVRSNVERFSADLDDEGQPREVGIKIAAEVNRERWDLPTIQLGAGHNIDHPFTSSYYRIFLRAPLHGMGVALGSLISAYLYEHDFDVIKRMLDDCRVRYRPADIGVTHAEVRTSLDRLNELTHKPGMAESVLHHKQLDDALFNEMLAAIEAA